MLSETAYRARVRTAATSAAMAEATAISWTAAELIVRRGTAALVTDLDGLPRDIAVTRAAERWLLDAVARFIPADAPR